MQNYTIYCTKDQTKKALELGAKISWCEKERKTNDPTLHEKGKCYKYLIPTAEQMIGWLEDQIDKTMCIHVIKEVSENNHQYFTFYIKHKKSNKLISSFGGYDTRKKATLRAIDEALDYLADNNLIK